MKKILSALLLTTFIAGTAEAAPAYNNNPEFFFKPSVGIDYQYTHVNYDDIQGTGTIFDGNNGDTVFSDSLHGANFHVGARVHRNLGFEAGYTITDEDDKSNVLGTGLDTSIQFSGFNFDVLGYVPVGDGRLELIGTAGVTRFKVDANIGGVSADESEVNGRVGVGAQYWITDNINARGLVRYQGADFDGLAENAIIGNAGLNFQF